MSTACVTVDLILSIPGVLFGLYAGIIFIALSLFTLAWFSGMLLFSPHLLGVLFAPPVQSQELNYSWPLACP